MVLHRPVETTVCLWANESASPGHALSITCGLNCKRVFGQSEANQAWFVPVPTCPVWSAYESSYMGAVGEVGASGYRRSNSGSP